MTGLLLIGVVATWFVASLLIARYISSRFRAHTLGMALGTFVFMALLIMPIADELIGSVQFKRLCDVGTALDFDEEKLRGATLTMRKETSPLGKTYDGPPERRVSGVAIPVYETRFDFFAPGNVDPSLSYKTYTARGGWLIRLLGTSNSDAPLLLDPSFCAPPENLPKLLARLHVKTPNWTWN